MNHCSTNNFHTIEIQSSIKHDNNLDKNSQNESNFMIKKINRGFAVRRRKRKMREER